MPIRTSEIVNAPYYATFGAVDLGGIEDIDYQIDPRVSEIDLVNGISLETNTGLKVSIILTLVETGGEKTALAALFPSIYTTSTGRGQLLWNVDTCGAGTAPGTLTIAASCDTLNSEDIVLYGAVPQLQSIETPKDGPRKIMIKFSGQSDATGKLLQVGKTA